MTGKRILVVDDEDSLRRVTQLRLHQAGYEASTAADGAEALQLLGQQCQYASLVRRYGPLHQSPSTRRLYLPRT